MDALDLKERIINDNNIELILEELGMHSIVEHGRYFSCGMPDGNRKNSTIIYKDGLNVDAYTRDIKDAYGNSDIISLTMYIRECYISEGIKWLCDICGYDYYGKSDREQRSALSDWTMNMFKVKQQEYDITEDELKPINECVLNYYGRVVTDFFKVDGITYETQDDFELGYDTESNMITIPIRDELGKLVGLKGRLFKEELSDKDSKYLYLHKCSKTKVLFGLNKTWDYIKKENEVIVVESEKAVMQLWSNGIRNAVAIGGHDLSKTQVRKLTYLNVPIVIAYDEGVEIGRDGLVDKSFYPNEFNKFIPEQTVYCMYDASKKILDEKESPSDNPEKWHILYKNKFKVRG